MAHQMEPDRVASIMLSWHSLELVSCRKIQTLWAGYGSICEVRARATTAAAAAEVRRLCRMDSGGNARAAGEDNTFALILKLVAPPPGGPQCHQGNGGEDGDEGHLRKMLSYEVEQHFYDALAPRLDPDRAAVARCLASTRDAAGKPRAGELLDGGRMIATLMTDLRPDFPVAAGERRRARLGARQVHAALDWLAAFHGASRTWVPEEESRRGLVRPPLEEAHRRRRGERGAGAWLNGGYTYLATRRKEYAALAADAGSEWSAVLCDPMESSPDGPSVAERVAELLAPRLGSGGDGGSSRDREREPYVSYIHGDVKSENLFATAAGDRVAFFDFQYVGLGLGVCDLAKLFTCSVPLGLLLTGCDDARDVPEELRMDRGERTLLKYYHRRLLGLGQFGTDGSGYDWELFVRHWEAALVDWLRFQMSWGVWGNTEWLEARVRSILRDEGFRKWLLES
ncbi:hypothetical protein DL764_008523 [Monosporascus ibericus]|uniref:Aminoglycoside phosphotransferase domain-containing protein n=1 Tax=Monosporascus ibericus TaxID=155417 RepID=A0A4Q4SXA3_9PEZI|nr:hypothetical protein DL764_008523 [Monosporascus ibericus]